MSEAYLSITGNNNGQPFPNTRAIDSTGPTATDGSEYVKEVTDDIWLAKQAELDFYNFDPNGLDNLAGVDALGYPLSQPLRLKYMNYAIPGTLVVWCSVDDPAVVAAEAECDIRIMLLNGQTVPRITDDFKLLDALCYVGDGDNATADSFYRTLDSGGSVRNIAGPHLVLPDMRGYSLRGLDVTGTVDPELGRIVGSRQDDATQGHWHNIQAQGTSGFLSSTVASGDSTAGSRSANWDPFVQDAPLVETTSAITDEINGTPRISSETRAKNMAVRFAIYY